MKDENRTGNNPQIVLITGASKGIGLEKAREFAKKGYKVYGTTRYPEEAHALQKLAEEFPNQIFIEQLDVGKASQDEINDLFKRIKPNILINNAAIGLHGPIETATEQQIREIMRINIIGVMRMTFAAIKHMQPGDLICAISSVAQISDSHLPFYSGTKAFIDLFMLHMKAYLADRGIKVVNFHPGPIETTFVHENNTKNGERVFEEGHPYPDIGELRARWHAVLEASYQQPKEVAEYIVNKIINGEFHVLNPTSTAVEAQFERVYVDPTGDVLYKLLMGNNIVQNQSQANIYETQQNENAIAINSSKNKFNKTKITLITDIDSDAGKATAEQFITAGYTVYGLTKKLSAVKNVHEDVKVIELNILNTPESELKKFIANIGPIDVLINNPTIDDKLLTKRLEELSEKDIDNIAEAIENKIVNIVKITDAVLPAMQAEQRKTGTILTLSSASAKVPTPLPTIPLVDSFIEPALNACIDNIMNVTRYYLNRFNIKVANVHPDATSTPEAIATTVLNVEAQKDPDFFTPISNAMKKLFGQLYRVLGKDFILTLPTAKKEAANENAISNPVPEKRYGLFL